MDFKFIMDKNYLMLKMISNRNNIEELTQWKNSIIVNILGIKIVEEIEVRRETIEEFFISGDFKQFVLDNHLNSKINQIIKEELFSQYYKETLKYLSLIQNTWFKFKNGINNWLKETIKLSPSKNPVSVYISHPKLNTGKCVDQKYIFWGHWKGIEDINYNIAYLCHENLHVLLPNSNCMPPAMKLYYEKSENSSNQEHWDGLNATIENYYKIFDFEFDVIHTVIELICDNELYTILSSNSKYGEGHNSLDYSLAKYKELILPYWIVYLELSPMEIKERVPNFVFKENRFLDKKDKLTIESFIQFLINNATIRKALEVPDLAIDTNLKK